VKTFSRKKGEALIPERVTHLQKRVT